MEIPPEILETVTSHDVCTLLDVSEASTSRKLPWATSTCLCSLVSGTTRSDRAARFKIQLKESIYRLLTSASDG